MNDKEKDEAELCLKVKADSGYEAEQKQRINVRQYSDICRILNGEKLPAATVPAQSEASEGRDADRMNWLCKSTWYVGPDPFYSTAGGGTVDMDNKNYATDSLRDAIDAAIALQSTKGESDQ